MNKRIVPSLLALLGACALAIPHADAAPADWLTDFDAALKRAAAEKKDLLVDFSGSDWCGWCQRLDEEVFSHKPFVDGASKTFLLVLLDFPRGPEAKAKIPETRQKRNEELREQFGIQGFPTVLLLSPDGKPYANTGYRPGGAEPYLQHLTELRQQRDRRAEMLAKVAQPGIAPGDKARLLDEIIALSDPEISGDTMAQQMREIVALDADNALGLKAKYELRARLLDAHSLMEKADADGAIKVFQGIIDTLKPTGDTLQEIYFRKGEAHFRKEDMEGVRSCLKAALDAAPKSEKAPQIEKMIQRFSAKPPTQ